MKRVITAAVLEQLPVQFATIDQVIAKWWMTNRQSGLRLTDTGDQAFRLASIEFFSCPLGPTDPGGYYLFLIEVNRKVKCPYFLGVTKVEGKNEPYIRIYDSKIAMLIGIYGNLRSYLESISEHSVRERK